MEDQQREESIIEALKERAAGNRKIAEGHRLLGRSIEIGQAHTKQSADNHHKAHSLIAAGHELLARADEPLVRIGERGRSKLAEAT